MNAAEILDQVKTLSVPERKELMKLMIDMLDPNEPVVRPKTGAEIAAMLQAMEPIEFVDEHIQDPLNG